MKLVTGIADPLFSVGGEARWVQDAVVSGCGRVGRLGEQRVEAVEAVAPHSLVLGEQGTGVRDQVGVRSDASFAPLGA
jgi:hypothetical protein